MRLLLRFSSSNKQNWSSMLTSSDWLGLLFQIQNEMQLFVRCFRCCFGKPKRIRLHSGDWCDLCRRLGHRSLNSQIDGHDWKSWSSWSVHHGCLLKSVRWFRKRSVEPWGEPLATEPATNRVADSQRPRLVEAMEQRARPDQAAARWMALCPHQKPAELKSLSRFPPCSEPAGSSKNNPKWA